MSHRPDRLIVNRGRRRFLIGSAGLLALPFLESLVTPSTASAWTPQPGGPRRLLVFFHGHGTIMEEFVPDPGFVMRPILQPVADAGLTDKTLVVTGVNSKVESGHPGAPSLFTCTPTGANQFNVTHATSPSIDHVIARHMQDGGTPRRIDVGVHDDSTNPDHNGISNSHTRTFWSGNNQLIDTWIKPSFVYERLFPDMGDPGAPAEDVDLRRRSVLDGVARRLQALEGRVSADDRVRLREHASRIRELELSLQDAMEMPSGPMCDGQPDVGPTSGITHERAAEVLVDLLAQAMVCNLADVGTFKVFDLEEPSWGHVQHPDLAGTFAGENYHGAWHRASDQRMESARRAFTPINVWYGSLFARLISRLDQIDEGDGTALDNSMVVWASDFGHGGGHSADNLHLVFAGHAGGAALGRHVDYASSLGRDPTAPYGHENQPGNHNLAVTMAQAFGVQGERFGDYASVRQPVEPGPLSL